MKASFLAHCFAAGSVVACGGTADIPDTPDLRALLTKYDTPTAALDATSALEALKTAPPLEDLQQIDAGLQAAAYIMGDVDHASDTSSSRGGTRIRLQGSINLQVRCPGELGNPTYDESINGSVSLTLAIADTQIRRSFGGQAKACVLRGKLHDLDAKVVLDGPLAFDVGKNIGIGSRWSGELLAQLPGTLTVLDREFRGLSGRLHEGAFQYLVTLDDGSTMVIQLGDDGITIRDGAGVWFCGQGESCAKQ